MSDLLDKLRNSRTNQQEVRRWTRRLRDRHNTLYFPHDIDFVLCPKNANSTMKRYYVNSVLDSDPTLGNYDQNSRRRRFNKFWERQEIDFSTAPQLFRYESYRIAIRRDPIDRILSAVKYLYKSNGLIDGDYNKTYLYDQVVLTLDNLVLRDNLHFFSQTYFLGKPSQYNEIYQMDNVAELIKKLDDVCPYNFANKNPEDWWFNKSSSTITVADLPTPTVDRLKELYRIDYKIGWGE